MTQPILLVDDTEDDVFFMVDALKKAGIKHPIQVASDGQKAIAYLKGDGEFSDRHQYPLPCLVLLDLKLPFIMGLDVLKWIRSQAEDQCIVLIMSASNDAADIHSAYRLGANAYLVKPSDTSKLCEMAKAIKDFWLTHTTLPCVPRELIL
jgi:DNA-binding response OmpR family regulator